MIKGTYSELESFLFDDQYDVLCEEYNLSGLEIIRKDSALEPEESWLLKVLPSQQEIKGESGQTINQEIIPAPSEPFAIPVLGQPKQLEQPQLLTSHQSVEVSIQTGYFTEGDQSFAMEPKIEIHPLSPADTNDESAEENSSTESYEIKTCKAAIKQAMRNRDEVKAKYTAIQNTRPLTEEEKEDRRKITNRYSAQISRHTTKMDKLKASHSYAELERVNTELRKTIQALRSENQGLRYENDLLRQSLHVQTEVQVTIAPQREPHSGLLYNYKSVGQPGRESPSVATAPVAVKPVQIKTWV